jgi:hypothetical protein
MGRMLIFNVLDIKALQRTFILNGDLSYFRLKGCSGQGKRLAVKYTKGLAIMYLQGHM